MHNSYLIFSFLLYLKQSINHLVMIENQDYLVIPKIQFNDMLNTSNVYKGRAILTKKYFFLLVDKVDNVAQVTRKDFYSREYTDSALANMSKIDTITFETDLLTQLLEDFVYPFANMEKFEVNVGFSVFGGIRLKMHGKKICSASIGNVKMRKAVKEFYENNIKI